MRARQGAFVGKFMNFMNRKNTVVIDLYERAFYSRKPKWEQLANFVHSDLCPSAELREGLVDVQLHPVKMMIFIKFKSELVRDNVVDKLQGMNGVMWTEYGVPVRGHSLDVDMKVITVLCASPETTEEDIKVAFVEAGIGEVVESTRGLLDQRRLPGVTNGKWKVRVKIDNPDKDIPSYIIRKEEGELWSLQFDGRRFVCWKCGSPDHIGDKCRDPERTFEEVFGEDNEPASVSWAAIVKGKVGQGPDLSVKREAIAKQIRENNERKAREKREAGERRQAEFVEQERVRFENETERQRRIAGADEQGKALASMNNQTEGSNAGHGSVGGKDDENVDELDNVEENQVLALAVEDHTIEGLTLPILLPRGDEAVQAAGEEVDLGHQRASEEGGLQAHHGTDRAGGQGHQGGGQLGHLRAGEEGGHQGQQETGGAGVQGLQGGGQLVGGPHGVIRLNWVDKSLLEPDRIKSALKRNPWQDGMGLTLDTSLERVFGQGATMLAIEFEGGSGERGESKDSISDASSDSEVDVTAISTPSKKRIRGGMNFGNLSGISGLKATHELSSDDESSLDPDNEVKKPRLAVDNLEDGSDNFDDSLGSVAVEESGDFVQSRVEQDDGVPLKDPGPTGDVDELSTEGSQ